MKVIVVLATEDGHTWLEGVHATRKGAADPILNHPDWTVVYQDDPTEPWVIGVNIGNHTRTYSLWNETVKE